MTCHIGEGIIICDGQSGGWRVTQASCPHCCLGDRQTRHLRVAIFGGWCGNDYLCGECGQKWSDDGGPWKVSNEEREENIAKVKAVPDPVCWDCHDTGDTRPPDMPLGVDPDDEVPRYCACAAGAELRTREETGR